MLLLLYGGGGDVRLVIKSIQSPFVFFSYFRLLYFTAWTLPIYFCGSRPFIMKSLFPFVVDLKKKINQTENLNLFTDYKPSR